MTKEIAQRAKELFDKFGHSTISYVDYVEWRLKTKYFNELADHIEALLKAKEKEMIAICDTNCTLLKEKVKETEERVAMEIKNLSKKYNGVDYCLVAIIDKCNQYLKGEEVCTL